MAIKYEYWNIWALIFYDFKYYFISQWMTWKDRFNLHFNSNSKALKRISSLMKTSKILNLSFFFFLRHSLSYRFHVNVISKVKKNWTVLSWANVKCSIYPLWTGSGHIYHNVSDFYYMEKNLALFSIHKRVLYF